MGANKKKVLVEINKTNDSLSIRIDSREFDRAYIICDKEPDTWFSPYSGRSGWKGLEEEIYEFVANRDIKIIYEINGSEEIKKVFEDKGCKTSGPMSIKWTRKSEKLINRSFSLIR